MLWLPLAKELQLVGPRQCAFSAAVARFMEYPPPPSLVYIVFSSVVHHTESLVCEMSGHIKFMNKMKC